MKKRIIIGMSIVCMLVCVYIAYKNDYGEKEKFLTGLYFNEVMTANGSCLDKQGKYPDWIEFYYSGGEILDLSEFYLSDDLKNLKCWKFPQIELQPDSYLVIYASGDVQSSSDNEIHTNFKIDCMGETIYLSDSSGKIVDTMEIPEIPFDCSYGISQDKDEYVIFETSTPGTENNTKTIKLKETEAVSFSMPAGSYEEEISINLYTNEESARIYYTLDGSVPTLNSLEYNGEALELSNRTYEENRYTSIWTSPDDWDGQEGISYNPNPQYKATVIKTRLYFSEEDTWSKDVWTNTYMIGEKYTLPIVSLTIEENDFFDEDSGIYVPGQVYENYMTYTDEIDPEPRNRRGNYSEDRKVSGYLEYFTEDGTKVMENKVTMRICGNISRGNGMKSLALYAWGDDQNGYFSYPFFGDDCKDVYGKTISKFESIRLRNFGNDWRRSKFRDALGQSLVGDLNLGVQGYQPCIVLLNGEYFGLFEIRENRDESFFENHFGIAKGNLEKVKIPDIGKVKETHAEYDFLKFVEFVKTHDLSNEEYYAYVESQIDVEQFLDYVLIQLYLNNIDWLKNNCDFFRTAVPKDGSENEDGRWRVILYDVDYSINYEDTNSYETFYDSEEYCAVLLKGLLENEKCKERYVQRFEELLENNFEPAAAIKKQEILEKQLAPEIKEDLSRWTVYYQGEILKTTEVSYWYEKMEDLRRFFVQRPDYAREYFYQTLP